MSSANVARLNAAILAHEQLEKDFRDFKDKAEKQTQLLYNENKLMKAENAHLKEEILERLARIESQLGFVFVDDDGVPIEKDGMLEHRNADTELDATAAPLDERASTPAVAAGKAEQDPESTASAQALKSKAFKDLMTKSFKALMGVQKLDGGNLPSYPMGIGESTDAWPKDSAMGKPLLRFDWRAGKHDDLANAKALQKIVEHIRATGNQMSTVTKTTIAQILPGEIEKVVRAKYMRMAQEYRKADKKCKRVDEDDLDDDVEVVEVILDRAHMNSTTF